MVRATLKASVTAQTFKIESIVCGDGLRKNAIALCNLVIYASARAVVGYESYHEIDGDSPQCPLGALEVMETGIVALSLKRVRT